MSRKNATICASVTSETKGGVTIDVHDAPEQIDPLLGRHRRKLAVGAADQDAVEAEADNPLDIPGQARIVERSISLEWRDGDVEQTAQSRVTFRDILHYSCPFEC